jgi:two-component system response regulator PilR (NtrC family)
MCEGEVIQEDDLLMEHVGVQDSQSETHEKSDEQSLDSYIEDIEKDMLEDALQKARYNKTKAAELLGISFRSFRYKLKKFGID